MDARTNKINKTFFFCFLPLSIISALYFFHSGHRANIAIVIIIAMWLRYGIEFSAREFPESSLLKQCLIAWIWAYFALRPNNVDHGQYNVYVNSVLAGRLKSTELMEIRREVIFTASNLFDQINEAIKSLIMASQLFIAYSGGLIVWAIAIGIYCDRDETVNVINNMINQPKSDLKIKIIFILTAIILLGYNLMKNHYRETINTKIRIILNVTSAGTMVLEKTQR
jgi:hypothetical protein